MKTYRVESKAGSISLIEAEAYVESTTDFRFLAAGFIVAQYSKSLAIRVVEIPMNSEELRQLLEKRR